jgi:hypothetical protein
MDIQVSISAMVRLKCDKTRNQFFTKKLLNGASTANNFYRKKKRNPNSLKKSNPKCHRNRFRSQGR